MSTRPPTLRLFQGLAVAVTRRDEVAVRQGLRVLTELVDEPEGVQIVRLLSNSLDGQGRYWLGTLDGARVGVPASGGPGKLSRHQRSDG